MLRITGGVFRGRMLETPSHQRTRPTQSRLRQALFNSLQAQIPDARVLDLFSGSGALGFEALSRGAASVVFIEESRQVAQVIERNARLLKVEDQSTILNESVKILLDKKTAGAGERLRKKGPFDLILADPPYSEGWETQILTFFPWMELLAVDGCFCLEWGSQKSQIVELPDQVPDVDPYLVKIREKNYGDSNLTTYRKASPDHSGHPSGLHAGEADDFKT